jgi:uncharacterized protein YdaU (DUF1376 family)
MNKSTPKRRRSAWFAFYPDDFSGGTRSMSLAGRGAFIELLSHQFSSGSIPPDDRTICRIIGAFPDEWDAVKAEVLTKFDTDDNGNFVNHRMQKEREEREEIRSKRVEAISKRWGKTDTNVSDLNKQNGYKSIDSVYTSPTSSPTSSSSKKNSESKDSFSSYGEGVSSEIDLDKLSIRIAELVPQWSPHLNADERAALFENERKWSELTDKDWALLARWYADDSDRSKYRTRRKAKLIAEVDQELGKAADALRGATPQLSGPSPDREPSGDWRAIWYRDNPDDATKPNGEPYVPTWQWLDYEVRAAIIAELKEKAA